MTRVHWRASTFANNLCVRGHHSLLGTFDLYRPEAGMLPGITWKRSMRSAFYWFSEFCQSRRLSQFAASFIVTRAEASIAKSCDLTYLAILAKHVDNGLQRVRDWWQANNYGGLPLATHEFNRGYYTTHELTVRFRVFRIFVEMILPQVHLRKPCYDFYFL